MVWILLADLALAAPDLYVDGACPGPASIRATHVTPGGRVAFVRASSPGSFVIPTGVCQGYGVELSAPSLATIATADANGTVELHPSLGAPACGAWLAAIDLSTCAASAPTPVTPEPTASVLFTDVSALIHLPTMSRTRTGWVVSYANNNFRRTIASIGHDGTLLATASMDIAVNAQHEAPGTDNLLVAAQTAPLGTPSLVVLDADLNLQRVTGVDVSGLWTDMDVAPDGAALAIGADLTTLTYRDTLFLADGSIAWTRRVPDFTQEVSVSRGPNAWLIAGLATYPNSRPYIARVGDDGATLTEDEYDLGPPAFGFAATELPGGSLLTLTSYFDTHWRCAVSHLSASGPVLWSIDIDLPTYADGFYCPRMALAHEGVIIAGDGYSPGGGSDIVAVHVDIYGTPHWAKSYGIGSVADAVAGQRGGFAVLGLGSSNTEARLISADANGRTSCGYADLPFVTSPLTMQWQPRLPTTQMLTDAPRSGVITDDVAYVAPMLDQCF